MNNPYDANDPKSGQRTASRPRRRSVFLGPSIVGACLALVGLAQWLAPEVDHQLANIFSAFLLAIACVTLAIWWFRRVPVTVVRWGVPLTALLAVAGFLILFVPVGFSGELVPQFRYRFAKTPDLQTETRGATLESGENAQVVIEPDSYPGFLGSYRDGRIEKRMFSRDWESNPPKMLWKQPIGMGLAGFAIATVRRGEPTDATQDQGPANDALSTVDQRIAITLEQRDQNETVTCYDLESGKLLWVQSVLAYHSHPLGDTGPRSTPTISGEGLVYAQGATGHVWCLDALTGKVVWQLDLLELSGINQAESEKWVTWGRAGSPLLVDDMVVLPMGGSVSSGLGIHSLIALDAKTGATRWTNGSTQISYASPVLATLDGVRQIVSLNEDSMTGHAVDSGNVLWSHPWPGASNGGSSCSNPAIVGDNQVLLSKGYGGGAALLTISQDNGSFKTDVVWSEMRWLKTKFTNAIIDGNFAYGLSDGTLECVDVIAEERRWRQPRGSRFGHGHITIVEDVILATTEEGEVVLVELNPDQYREIGRFAAVEGKTWNPAAISGSYVLVRNSNEMSLWDLGINGSND
jgi:outer membrane protein assembly factor BamB